MQNRNAHYLARIGHIVDSGPARQGTMVIGERPRIYAHKTSRHAPALERIICLRNCGIS